MSILRLTNFEDHPGDHRYMVFTFQNALIAREFMDQLRSAGIPYEQDEGDGPPFLVGVKKHHREQAVRLNYLVTGKYRERFIADDVFRWTLLVFVGIAVVLAIVGMLNR